MARVETPARLGKLQPPFPYEVCASSVCDSLFTESGAYLFRDLEGDKLIVLCEDCAADVELNHRERFILVAL